MKRSVRYYELYTIPSEQRVELLRNAISGSTRIRVMLGIAPKIPLLDFVVIDSEAVMFSRPNVEVHGGTSTLFVLVRNAELAQMFAHFFLECWDLGRPVTLSGNAMVFEDTREAVAFNSGRAIANGGY